MLTNRLRGRCPSATKICAVDLNGHELLWQKSSKDGSAKCDIVTSEGSLVWGVVFEIAEDERIALDKAEGVGFGYERSAVVLSNTVNKFSAVTYKATSIDRTLKPYCWYKELVIAGAYEHELPSTYVEMLEAVEFVNDPDRNRRAQNNQLIAKSTL